MAVIWGSFLYLFREGILDCRRDFKSGLVRFRFLTVKRIDFTARQHVCQDQVFEYLNPLRRTGLVIVPEGFEEIFTCSIPLP